MVGVFGDVRQVFGPHGLHRPQIMHVGSFYLSNWPGVAFMKERGFCRTLAVCVTGQRQNGGKSSAFSWKYSNGTLSLSTIPSSLFITASPRETTHCRRIPRAVVSLQ